MRSDQRKMPGSLSLGRRSILGGLLAAGGLALVRQRSGAAAQQQIISKPIPATREELPVVGLGSWITFNVGEDPQLRDECTAVMEAFFNAGGRLIDSSPMYGSSQAVIGNGLSKLGKPRKLFAADKVWTPSPSHGLDQIERSRTLWNIPHFDLLQVHNLVGWEDHLPMLLAMKEKGELRYVGITTSEGRRHPEFERIMRSQPLDFVQLTYNVVDREAERRIFPLAQDLGMAVIVNRPFQQGVLIERLKSYPLPEWAKEFDALNWPQFILKFIISHPAVTCAIPATSRVDHVRENMDAAFGRLPDQPMRARMVGYVEQL
jgi:diketogulonate reductase-like aldo/keto reductase